MSVSAACESGEHARCMRPSCDCWCGHERRAALHADAERLMARDEPGSIGLPLPCAVEPVAPARSQRRSAAPERRGGAERRQRARSTPRPRSASHSRSGGPLIELPVDEIVASYAAGATISELAARHRVSPETIRKRLVGAGAAIRPTGGGTRRVSIDADEAKRLYEDERWSIERCARHFGCSPKTMRDRLHEAGATMRAAAHAGNAWVRDRLDVELIVREYADGASMKRLSRDHGCAIGTIRTVLERGGARIRAQGDRSTVLPDAEIADAYLGGLSLEGLGRRYSVSATTIAAHLRRAGIEPKPGGHPVAADHVDYGQAAVDYASGMSVGDVAQRHGISETTLWRRFKAMGIETRPQGSKPNGVSKRIELPVDELVERYRTGATLEALAEQYGCAWSTIRQRLVEHGVRIRAWGERGT